MHKFQTDVATCINEDPDPMPVEFMHGIQGTADRFVLRAISPVWRAQMRYTTRDEPFALKQITQAEFDRIQSIWLGEDWKMKPPLTMEQILRLMLLVDQFQISDFVLDQLRERFETLPIFPADIRAICNNENLEGNLPPTFANQVLLPRIIELAPDTIRSPTIAALVDGHALDPTGLLWHFKDTPQPEKVLQILPNGLGFRLQCDRLPQQKHGLKATTLYALDDTRRILCAIDDAEGHTVVLEIDIVAGKILNCRRLAGKHTIYVNATDLFDVRDEADEFDVGVYTNLETFFQGVKEDAILTFTEEINLRIVHADRFCVFTGASMSMFVRESARYKEAWDKKEDIGLQYVRHAQYFPATDRVLVSGFHSKNNRNDLYLKLLGQDNFEITHHCGRVQGIGQRTGAFCVVDGLVYQYICNSIEVLDAADLSQVRSITTVAGNAFSLLPHGPEILFFDCAIRYEHRISRVHTLEIKTYLKRPKDICKLGFENTIFDIAVMHGKLIAMDTGGVLYVLSREEIIAD